MFTGIIESIGTIKKVELRKNLTVLTIELGPLAGKVKLGDSVSVSGACLTVVSKKGSCANFEMMKETITKTSLRSLKAGDRVNLESALKAGSPMGGHFVTGHVDELGIIKNIDEELNWVALQISISKANRKLIAPKGSVTIDGISLTVGRVGKDYFEVYLIPYTLEVTTLGTKKAGDWVNIETDILAKYILGR